VKRRGTAAIRPAPRLPPAVPGSGPRPGRRSAAGVPGGRGDVGRGGRGRWGAGAGVRGTDPLTRRGPCGAPRTTTRRPKLRPSQQPQERPQARSRPLPAVDSEEAAPNEPDPAASRSQSTSPCLLEGGRRIVPVA
jgi:hypothetical protein